MPEAVSREASLEKIVFHNEETGYLVGIFRDSSGQESFTAAGTMENPIEDQRYILYGFDTRHPKYGNQFKIQTYEIELPTTRHAFIKFLSSSRFTGVGRKTAEKIYDAYEEDAMEILAAEPERLVK